MVQIMTYRQRQDEKEVFCTVMLEQQTCYHDYQMTCTDIYTAYL